MRLNRDQNQGQNDCFYYFPYRSYEEIQMEKRRKVRIRRGLGVCGAIFFVAALVAVGIGFQMGGRAALLLGSAQSGVSTWVSSFGEPAAGGQSGTSAQAGEDEAGFQLQQSDPAQGTVAIYVKDVSAIVRQARRAVVGVTCEVYSTFTQQSSGSGIIMSENGYIITNNHVISGGDSISVTLDGGESYPALVIGADALTDLAVLKIEAEDLPVAEFGDSDILEAGQAAVAIGNPTGQLQGSVTAGIISAVNRNVAIGSTVMNLIQTDAAINNGNSGGPLLNQYGQVVGVNSVKLGVSYGYEGISFAIPINTVRPIVEQLVERGYVSGRPLLGVSCSEISKMASAFYALPQGLLIQEVDPASNLDEQGVTSGDIILAVAGQRVTGLSEASALRNGYAAGDTIDLSIYRKGKQYDLQVVLIEQNAENGSCNY